MYTQRYCNVLAQQTAEPSGSGFRLSFSHVALMDGKARFTVDCHTIRFHNINFPMDEKLHTKKGFSDPHMNKNFTFYTLTNVYPRLWFPEQKLLFFKKSLNVKEKFI